MESLHISFDDAFQYLPPPMQDMIDGITNALNQTCTKHSALSSSIDVMLRVNENATSEETRNTSAFAPVKSVLELFKTNLQPLSDFQALHKQFQQLSSSATQLCRKQGMNEWNKLVEIQYKDLLLLKTSSHQFYTSYVDIRSNFCKAVGPVHDSIDIFVSNTETMGQLQLLHPLMGTLLHMVSLLDDFKQFVFQVGEPFEDVEQFIMLFVAQNTKLIDVLVRSGGLLYCFPFEGLAGKEGDSSNCPICLEEYKKHENVVSLRCGHLFHSDCIRISIFHYPQCPICRSDVFRPDSEHDTVTPETISGPDDESLEQSNEPEDSSESE